MIIPILTATRSARICSGFLYKLPWPITLLMTFFVDRMTVLPVMTTVYPWQNGVGLH
jgi:hypothetical protein